MDLLKKGFYFLLAATVLVACSDDDDSAPVGPIDPGNGGGGSDHPLAGTSWVLTPGEGSLIVGPNATDVWWQNSAEDVATRACLFDDVYTFNADNSYSQDMQDQTWLEGAPHGAEAEGCGALVAPWNGSNPATWSADSSTVTVVGDGAFLGLAKVTNTDESGDPADDTIVYNYSLDGDNLTITIQGFHPEPEATWTFKFTKQ